MVSFLFWRSRLEIVVGASRFSKRRPAMISENQAREMQASYCHSRISHSHNVCRISVLRFGVVGEIFVTNGSLTARPLLSFDLVDGPPQPLKFLCLLPSLMRLNITGKSAPRMLRQSTFSVADGHLKVHL